MERYDITIPYIEVRDKNTREIIGMIEGAEIFFEYNFHECGSFEIYCRADDNAIELLKKDRYVTLPVNADNVTNLIEPNSNIWVIQKIQKTNDVSGGRWIIATGKEAKQIVDKRIIRNTAKLDKDADVSTEVRTKLLIPNLLDPNDTRRPISGLTFIEDAIGENIKQNTQVTYDNLFTYTEELYKTYAVGAKLRLDRNNKNMIYEIYKGTDRSNDVIFSHGNDNLLNSDYTEDWAEYKTSALVGGEEKEVTEYDDYGKVISKHTKRTMTVVEDSSSDIDRREVYIDARDLQSSYEEEVNGVLEEKTYTASVYNQMLRARGKETLSSENNVILEFNGEIDTANNKYIFNIDYYLGDLVKIRDDDLQKEITVRVSKFTKVQNNEGYKEYFEYEEISTLNYIEPEAVEGALLTENDENLLTEDGEVLLVEEVPMTYSTRSVTTTSADGIRISELPVATNINEDCCLPIVSEYETKRITYGGLKERLSNDLDISGEAYDDTEIRNEIEEVRNSIPSIDGLASETYVNTQVSTLQGNIDKKVDKITTVNSKPLSSNITLTASDVGALSDDTELFSGDYNDLSNKPTIPTTASQVGALPNTTKYGASLSLTMNTATYVVTAQLKDQDGNNLGTAQTIDLPLESVVVSGSYNDTNKKVILTLKDGSTIDFSVADLIDGLASQSSVDAKYTKPSTGIPASDLAEDYVTETELTNKDYVTTTSMHNSLIYKASTTYVDSEIERVEGLIAQGGGTAVSVNGTPVATLEFDSNPQTQLNFKTDKVVGATANNLAHLDVNGNLKDSGISKNSVALKVTGATAGNLASLDVNGNLKDSGFSTADIENNHTNINYLHDLINRFSMCPSGTVYSYGSTTATGSITATDTQLTAPCNGYLQLYWGMTTNAGYVNISNHGSGLCITLNVIGAGNYPTAYMPVKVGDLITITYSSDYTNGATYYFIKALEE